MPADTIDVVISNCVINLSSDKAAVFAEMRRVLKPGAVNPPEAWVWSEEPTHEAIVTREVFETAMGMTEVRKRSRSGSGSNLKHPDTKRSYPLRSFIICALCGCRMFGKANRAGTPYYVCQPSLNWGSDAKPQFPGHPPTVWVREDHLLEAIIGFFGERVFGPHRTDLLEQDLRSFDGEPERKRERQMRSLRRAIDKLDLAQARASANSSRTTIPREFSSGGSDSVCPN